MSKNRVSLVSRLSSIHVDASRSDAHTIYECKEAYSVQTARVFRPWYSEIHNPRGRI